MRRWRHWATAHARQLLASSTGRVILGVVGGNLLATVVSLVGTLVQARFVGPDDLGYLRKFAIITNYAFFLHLGIWHALQRRYPLYVGQGRRGDALAVCEISQAWNVGVTALSSGIFVVLALVVGVQGNWRAALAWLVQAAAMASNFYGGYLGATYRSGHDFTTASKSSVVASVTGLLCLPVFPFWPYVGLVLRSSLGGLTSLVYLHVRRPLRLSWRFNLREWWRLLKEGLPLFTASYLTTTGWAAVEASLVLRFLSVRALGLWGASVMFLEMARMVPQAIGSVYVPRLTEQYGRTGSVRACLALCRKPMIVGGLGVAALAAGMVATVPILVTWLMPKYVDAIPTMCLMMIYLPITVLEIPQPLPAIVGRLALQNVASAAGLSTFVGLATAAHGMGWGLNGLVGASILGRLVRLGVIYGFLADAVRREAGTAVTA